MLGSAIIQPTRNPARPYDLVKLFVEMNTSSRLAAGRRSTWSGRSAWSPPRNASRYTSSTITLAPTERARSPTACRASCSAYTPDGLCRLVTTTARVSGVSAASTRSGLISKRSSHPRSNVLTFAPRNRAAPPWGSYPGHSTRTASPGLNNAASAMKFAPEAPDAVATRDESIP